LNRGSFNGAHIHGTDVPVEEPSTASIGDIGTKSGQRRRPCHLDRFLRVSSTELLASSGSA